MYQGEMEAKIRRQEDRLNLLEADVRRMENDARREGHMMEFLKGAVEGFMAQFERLEEQIRDHEAWASTHDHPHEHDDEE